MTDRMDEVFRAARAAYQAEIDAMPYDHWWYSDGGETDKPIRAAIAAAMPYIGRVEENDRLRALLLRYRNETPLGHQPHMIAAEVDAALSHKGGDQS